MKIKDLYRELALGSLSNLAMADGPVGTLTERGQQRVINAANEALLRLYARFVLKQKDILIEMVEHITNYHLLSRFAECTTPRVETYTYIKDLPLEPFEEDVIKILSVYESQWNRKLPLNDPDLASSVFTPQPDVLQVPHPNAGQALSVSYQAKHTPLIWDQPEQPIELPEVLMGAFKSYIAYLIFSPMGQQDATIKAQEHLAIYDEICTGVVENDLLNLSESSTSTRFEKRGWV